MAKKCMSCGGSMKYKKGGSTFPDLNHDGKVDKKDVLKGRGVPGFKKGGAVKKKK